jgi:hypothetical protein
MRTVAYKYCKPFERCPPRSFCPGIGSESIMLPLFSFGTVNGARDPRKLQLAGRITF